MSAAKKVLITGSNGFIGGHVVNYFKQSGWYVIGLGRRNEPSSKVDAYFKCDLATDKVFGIFDYCKVDRVDAVVHLAADMRHEPYTVDVVTNNCGGTQRLIELCEKTKIPVFIQLSSLPVIGRPTQHPISEEHPLKPPTVYHVTKVTQEMLAEYARYTFGLRTMSFRISAPVGIGMNPKTIFPVFVNNALNNDDITLLGKGTRRQTYIHVKDIAQAILKGIESEAYGVFNLASENCLSNYELACSCIKVLGSQSHIRFSDRQDPADDFIWDVSLDKIKEAIGYQPMVGIEEAIAEYADAIRKSDSSNHSNLPKS